MEVTLCMAVTMCMVVSLGNIFRKFWKKWFPRRKDSIFEDDKNMRSGNVRYRLSNDAVFYPKRTKSRATSTGKGYGKLNR
jgi:hypothetical protein